MDPIGSVHLIYEACCEWLLFARDYRHRACNASPGFFHHPTWCKCSCIIIKCVWRNFDEISAMMVVLLRCWNVANWFLSSSSDNDTASVEMRKLRDKDHDKALKKCHPTMGLSPELFQRLSPNHPNFPWNKRAARTLNNKILTLKMRQAASREETRATK